MYYSSQSLFEGNEGKILLVILILQLYVIIIKKANKLAKITMSWIPAGQYLWTTWINMSLSTACGGKLN